MKRMVCSVFLPALLGFVTASAWAQEDEELLSRRLARAASAVCRFLRIGIAIDINTQLTEYWNWTYGDELDDIVYRNRLPYEIAAVFERHGFIWGGKWYHYDTMHFEYRPELLEPADD